MQDNKEISKLKQFFYDIGHAFWLIGKIYISIFKLDFPGAGESYLWLRIHLTMHGKLIKVPNFSTFHWIKTKLVQFVGFSGTIIIIYFIVKLVIKLT